MITGSHATHWFCRLQNFDRSEPIGCYSWRSEMGTLYRRKREKEEREEEEEEEEERERRKGRGILV